MANIATQLRTDMTEAEIMRKAPAVYAETASTLMTGDYVYIPTYILIQYAKQNGFRVFNVKQTNTRISENVNLTKHVVEMLNPDTPLLKTPKGTTYAGLKIINSHNGGSSFRVLAASWVEACSNSPLLISSIEQMIRIMHKGNALEKLGAGLPSVLAHIDNAAKSVNEMNEIQLNDQEAIAMARIALDLRWKAEANDQGVIVSTAPISAGQVLETRHNEGKSLWDRFNVIEENLMKGKLQYVGSKRKTQEIKSIDVDTNLHLGLWKLAEGIKQSILTR